MTPKRPDRRSGETGTSDGKVHLDILARAPRAPGSAEERAARQYCADVLRGLGYEVAIEPFEYSALPGRYGTPIGGALATITVIVAAWMAAIRDAPRSAAIALGVGLLLLALFTRRMLGDGVLDLPTMRSRGENLVARRAGASAARVWLVAHVDTKSQPIPSRVRIAGVASTFASLVVTLVALLLTLGSGSPRTLLWSVGVGLAVIGGAAVMASVVGNESPGAVDNASGVAAILSAAAMIEDSAAVGILIPSAEELGLAGARAWVRSNGDARGLVLNCDGVDDQGELTLMYTRRMPDTIVNAVREVASDVRVRRMPPGLLLDSVAFADAGWEAATLSHGSMRTLARVHTRGDSLEALRGEQIEPVARVLARAAEALAR